MGDRVIFFFNDTATTEIYTLSLHDALPISVPSSRPPSPGFPATPRGTQECPRGPARPVRVPDEERGGTGRSEEHTSELQSRQYLVCRLLLEKKTSARVVSVHQHLLRRLRLR